MVRARLIEAVEARRIPGRFLYDSPAQASRYLAYQRAWAPRALGGLYDRAFAAAIARTERPYRWVGLGCGGGARDARFHEMAGVPALLTDTSPSLLLEAMERIVSAEGLAVDLEVQPERAAFGEDRALFGAFGLLPNFEHGSFLGWLSALLRAGEILLLSANLAPDGDRAAIVAQYDNAEARAWYGGALSELGLFDAEVVVRAAGTDEVWRIEVEARPRRDQVLSIFDASIPIARDEPLGLFSSTRFTAWALPPIFEAAGLALLEPFVHESGEEGVYLLSKVTSPRAGS